MANVLASVDRRTKLAGENRLELLLFQLQGKQLYGINVFKVKEIIEMIPLTQVPSSNPIILGITSMRGNTFPVFDLNYAIGYERVEDISKCKMIITEYNQSIQGFAVANVNKIINLEWDNVKKPPAGSGKDNLLTAITSFEEQLIEVIDVEKILNDVSPASSEVSEDTKKIRELSYVAGKKVLVCDDSKIARKQVTKTLEQVGIQAIEKTNGREALDYLKMLARENNGLPSDLLMMISDIEMPEMDGYKLTKEVREDDLLKELFVVLHSSLSGVFNEALVKQVGADQFIAKFDPEVIVWSLLENVKCAAEKQGIIAL